MKLLTGLINKQLKAAYTSSLRPHTLVVSLRPHARPAKVLVVPILSQKAPLAYTHIIAAGAKSLALLAQLLGSEEALRVTHAPGKKKS